MNKSEEIAKQYLQKMGWNPEETNSYTHNSGTPDFICSNNRYVEIKRYTSTFYIQINDNQLNKWSKLLKANKRIFLIVISRDNKILNMFEILNGGGIDGMGCTTSESQS